MHEAEDTDATDVHGGTRRRKPSSEGVARRAERLLMAPYRHQIDDLQTRIAFLGACAASIRPLPPDDIAERSRDIAAAIAGLQTEIEKAMAGRTEVGPADDCRRALRSALAHLPRAQ